MSVFIGNNNKIKNSNIGRNKKREKELEERIIIMEKYFELIYDIGFDCDGCNTVMSLKRLIKELTGLASLGRVCNTTQVMYIDDEGKQYNILHEEIKDE